MKTYQALYQRLSKADEYVSGERLANDLQLSRTAIWKAIQRLEREGLVIDSIKNRGYKILHGDLLLKEEIEALAPVKVSINPQCQSTQIDAKRAIETGGKPDTLYLAVSQTAGRGRFGRTYFCPKQGGIYMSLHIKPQLSFEELPSYTLLTAASIYKAIKDLTLIETDIKWVNDIYFKEKKIAGILTEAISNIETGLVTDLIIGVGLNFSIDSFPETLQKKAGSLFTGRPPITRNELIGEIWKNLYTLDPSELLYLYKKRSFVLGKQVSFLQNNQNYTGLAKTISDKGQLLVELADGQEMWLNSGEISLKKW